MGFEIAALLAESIDEARTTVRPFDGFLFLCGGAIEKSESGFASARHYALSRSKDGKIGGHRIMLAEKMTSLLQGDDFQDLLEFEEHIAALSACVLIFVESPGSIAELGSFAVMKHLSPKLLVVCEQKFESATQPSFIFLGPVASLRRHRNESVQIFPLFEQDRVGRLIPDEEMLGECWDYIEEAIVATIKRPISESEFDSSELSHQMVLVATLVNLANALRVGELEEWLANFNVEASPKELRRILKMLEQFGMVIAKTYGNDKFYHSKLHHPLLTFRPRAGGVGVFDSVRFKTSALEIYKERDPRKYKAIKALLKEATAG